LAYCIIQQYPQHLTRKHGRSDFYFTVYTGEEVDSSIRPCNRSSPKFFLFCLLIEFLWSPFDLILIFVYFLAVERISLAHSCRRRKEYTGTLICILTKSVNIRARRGPPMRRKVNGMPAPLVPLLPINRPPTHLLRCTKPKQA
jgi:hypothetical protein